MSTQFFKIVFLFVAVGAVASQPTIPADELTMQAGPFVPVLTLRAESNTVQLSVTVQDSENRYPDRLARKDFQVFDQGKLQTLSGFAVDHELPVYGQLTGYGGKAKMSAPPAGGQSVDRWVALYFPDFKATNVAPGAAPQSWSLIYARNAAKKVIEKGWSPRQHMAIFTASGSISVGFTGDRNTIESSLDKINGYTIPGSRNIGLEWHMEAENFERVCQGMAALTGDKTIVVFITSSFPGANYAGLPTMVQSALRAGVRVNAVDAKGLVAPSGGADVGAGMRVFMANAGASELTDDTGGKMFQNNNDLPAGLRELSSPAEVTYRLAFKPSHLVEDGSFHKLQVKVTAPGSFDVRAPSGYMAPSGSNGLDLDAGLQQILDREATSAGRHTDMDAICQVVAVEAGDAPPAVKAAFDLNPNTLSFKSVGGRHVDDLVFVSALFDAQDKFVAGRVGVMALRLRDNTLDRVSKPAGGLSVGLDVVALPGKYRAREIVLERGSNKLATFNSTVEVPPPK